MVQVHGYEHHEYNNAFVAVAMPTIYRPSTQPAGYCYQQIAAKNDPSTKYVRRIPLMSLAVVAKGSIDLGIENKGAGWFPMFWAGASSEGPTSPGQQPYNPATVPVHASATTANIQVGRGGTPLAQHDGPWV